ncbi:hypothetical protein T484DRAFT_1814370, partial [Baffinella frigidus]
MESYGLVACRISADKTQFALETNSTFLDIPYGDAFVVNSRWDLVAQPGGGSLLKIRGDVKFHKRCLFKSKITSETAIQSQKSFA